MESTKTIKDVAKMPCDNLHGVGKKMSERLAKLGILSIQDLLFHLPVRYIDRTRINAIRTSIINEYNVIEGIIETVSKPVGGKTRLLVTVSDGTGVVSLRFFFIHPSQVRILQPGMQLRCFGEIRFGAKGREMFHPEYKIIEAGKTLPIEETLTPVYPATEGISQGVLRKMTQQALDILTEGGLQEILPGELLKELNFPSIHQALEYVHRPPAKAPVAELLDSKHATQKRLIFEELLAHRLSLLQLKKQFQKQEAIAFDKPVQQVEAFLKEVKFNLTGAQQRVSQEIAVDLARPFPMLRLVQGDVGSGKTVVAALAILQVVAKGYQAAILAPTELLAEQHYQTFRKWFAPLNINTKLLSGSLKTAEKREALSSLENEQAQVIVGTHAIFQKKVVFGKLGMIVVDEQHRFGVEQRAMLREKGMFGNFAPHQLIMTATPIPRTLAMSIYADLDYSVIDELPPGRIPITTSVISNTKRADVLQRIEEACKQGRQVYWVCTLIEDSEVLEASAAESSAKELQHILPNCKVGLLHGRMKPQEKDAIMQAFKAKQIDLLVATTVIEVGVDVPNASLMIIENAERLGLAQLHQLRGRVGRGSQASFCVLMYQSPLSQFGKERLAVMRETTDGFKIAEKDLQIRGPGEVLGTKQTGDVTLKIADLIRDSELIPSVQNAAAYIEKNNPERIDSLIKRWVGTKEKFSQV